MRSLYVRLPDPAIRALADEARRELRSPKEQAAYLIVIALRRSGALADESDRRETAAAR